MGAFFAGRGFLDAEVARGRARVALPGKDGIGEQLGGGRVRRRCEQ